MAERMLGGLNLEGASLLRKTRYVLFDTDNIVVDTASEVIQELKTQLYLIMGNGVDLNFGPDDIKGWNQLSRWAQERGLSSDEANKLESAIWKNQKVIARSRPVSGSLELIRRFGHEGKGVGLFTSRPPDQRDLTEKWSKNYLDFDLPVFIRENDSISGEVHKASVAAAKASIHKSVLVVDDSPDHILKVLEYTEGLDVSGILVPFGNIELPEKVAGHARLKVIPRITWDRGLWDVHKYFGFISS